MSTKKVSINKAQASQSIINAGLSAGAQSILVKNLNAKTIAGATGVGLDGLQGDMTTLALVIIDASGSMDKEAGAVERDFGEDLQAIKDSAKNAEILMSIWYFNTATQLVHSFLPLDLVAGLPGYHPNGGTAFNDAFLDGVTSLLAYEAELKKLGQRTKLNIALFYDGRDNSSTASTGDVATVIKDLLKRENVTITLTGFMGNERDPREPFDPVEIALEIGLPASCVVKAGATPKERRAAWGAWSSSVIKTSQTQIGTSGGLFTP